eukprot:TRINITY_DN137_c0_g1_i2.p1 TRINITY_DN137_c0_g1~~TRINITY_DN137_c0_g1_i2.p1  ORF type:complete len:150 (+),score=42.32 TRINITY_DN137_c0_g1_i2:141-590(+)
MKAAIAGLGAVALVLNFIRAAIAGDVLNEIIDGTLKASDQNSATTYVVLAALTASMVGLAAGVSALVLFMKWDAVHTAVALGLLLLSLFQDIYTMGLGFKQWDLDGEVSDNLNSIGAFSTILAVVVIVLLLLVGCTAPGNMAGKKVEQA